MSLAGCLLVIALGLGLYARRWVSLAGRSRVGARSEDQVQRALAVLETEGWRLRQSLRWLGPGDIDSVAITLIGLAVVIETKTKAYEERHLSRVRVQAAWVVRRRRRWCRTGAVAVLCLARARGVHRVDRDVLVVSIDQLIPALRRAIPPVSRRVAQRSGSAESGRVPRRGRPTSTARPRTPECFSAPIAAHSGRPSVRR